MGYDENQIRERIMELMHREGLSQTDLAMKIGTGQPTVSDILRGRRTIQNKFIGRIINAFPQLNREWLLFGEGTMCDGDVSLSEVLHEDTRPRLPKSISGGHLTDYYDGDKRYLCQEQDIVAQFSDYDFSMILKDSHMSPKYERGDELFFRKVTIIEWGNDYLLDTSEGPKFKKVYDANDCYRCVSYNTKEFPEFQVPKNMVFGYYKLVGVLRIL